MKKTKNKQGSNQYKTIARDVEVIKELTPYQKYKELCKIEWRIKEIKKIIAPLIKEGRSLAQKRSDFIMTREQLNGFGE